MQETKMCTKDLYNVIVHFIQENRKMVIKAQEYIKEEVLGASYRFIELLIANDETTKDGLIKLLDKLNNLGAEFDKNYNEALQEARVSGKIQEEVISNFHTASYLVGRVALLRSMINNVLDKLLDSEKKLTLEERQEIIAKSKINIEPSKFEYIN